MNANKKSSSCQTDEVTEIHSEEKKEIYINVNNGNLKQKEILDHLTSITHHGEKRLEVGGWPTTRKWKLIDCTILTPDTDAQSLFERIKDDTLLNETVEEYYNPNRDSSYDFVFMIDTIHFLSFEDIENLIRMSKKGVIYVYQPRYIS